MARRKDPEIRENVDRGEKNEQGFAGTGATNNDDAYGTNPSDTIKNANAAGLGAMGRNDQKQDDSTADAVSE